ncbi:uroporphyrinogen-III synthase [Oceanobacillus piezotolerans]|uniref:Uroporphyrinogen-III synthase n=1 Tax=Oceanobacillus piezotolerans TaxID=2448030 RepID=A0A498DAE5_9BACI|nr:uroporphyrinogen-III synthase [Oceanobacillus piezotolerans]RLL47951.1 uroporphyrinogen-III synthase [Oceanobacillus piezotolerans]
MKDALEGKRILITRDEKGAKLFSKQLKQLGAVPLEVPLIKIQCKCEENNWQGIKELHSYEWIIFTSANGVRCFFQLLNKKGRTLTNQRIAVVGHKTEDALKEFGLTADLVPPLYNAETLASEFMNKYYQTGTILLVRGNLSRDVLPKRFFEARVPFDMLEVYETVANHNNKENLNEILSSQLDFITFTSPSAVEAFCNMTSLTGKWTTVCIGSTTEEMARNLGMDHIISPESDYTMEGMIQRMTEYSYGGDV